MFRTIDRYIGRQVLSATLFGLAVLSLVLVLLNIFKKVFPMLEKGEVPLSYLGMLIAYILPFSLSFTIPWGFLMAVLLIFGRLSADNELLSLRMAGLSMSRICRPIFLLAALLTAACFWVNVKVVPFVNTAKRQLLYDLVDETPERLFGADQIRHMPGYVFYTGEKDGASLKNLQIVDVEKRTPSSFIVAQNVEVRPKAGEDAFTMVLKNVSMEMRDSADLNDLRRIRHGISVGELTYDISLEEIKKDTTRNKPNAKSTGALRREMATGIDTNTGETLDAGDVSVLRTEYHRRFSFSLACFTFALVGIPLGVTAQRKETSIGFVLSLIVAILYFLMVILAETFCENPAAQPHLLIWLPNLAFLSLGGLLFWRLSRT